MADLAQWFGNDLNVAASGDLLTVSGVIESEQQIVRRLLTPPGSYIWEPTYGVGLGQYIGRPNSTRAITAAIRAQLLQESSVARNPAPQVSVTTDTNGVTTATVSYWNTLSNAPSVLSFPIN